VSPFDHASLAAEVSQCMEQLGMFGAARQASEQVISLRTTSHARSRAFGQLRLSSVLLSLGEVEQASTVAEAALASSDRLSSNRVVTLLHALHAQLLPHASTPAVQPIAQALSTALSTRAPARLLIAAAGDPQR
jgi:hypothetical protein